MASNDQGRPGKLYKVVVTRECESGYDREYVVASSIKEALRAVSFNGEGDIKHVTLTCMGSVTEGRGRG